MLAVLTCSPAFVALAWLLIYSVHDSYVQAGEVHDPEWDGERDRKREPMREPGSRCANPGDELIPPAPVIPGWTSLDELQLTRLLKDVTE